jgi:hypothetical protein
LGAVPQEDDNLAVVLEPRLVGGGSSPRAASSSPCTSEVPMPSLSEDRSVTAPLSLDALVPGSRRQRARARKHELTQQGSLPVP